MTLSWERQGHKLCRHTLFFTFNINITSFFLIKNYPCNSEGISWFWWSFETADLSHPKSLILSPSFHNFIFTSPFSFCSVGTSICYQPSLLPQKRCQQNIHSPLLIIVEVLIVHWSWFTPILLSYFQDYLLLSFSPCYSGHSPTAYSSVP